MGKVKDLVVDSGAFLRNCPLQDYGENIYTCEDVLSEIKSKSAIDRLQVLPYDIKIKEPENEDLELVKKFSKKTGDFFNLSNTDLKVIALAVCLEREKNGNLDHLKTTPASVKIVSNQSTQQQKKSSKDDFGFNFKNKLEKNKFKEEENENESKQEENVELEKEIKKKVNFNFNDEEKDNVSKDSIDNDEEYYSDLTENDYGSCEENENNSCEENEYNSCEENESDGDFNKYYTNLIKTNEFNEKNNSDDEGDWITPINIDLVKQQFEGLKIEEKKSTIELNTACITGDFSMQNVLMQLGIKVISVEKGAYYFE